MRNIADAAGVSTEMRFIWALVSCACMMIGVANASTAALTPGLYRTSSAEHLYVGTEQELPDPAASETYDPQTQRIGAIGDAHGVILERGITEERRTVTTRDGRLGVSFYHVDRRKRAAVILIHGNDPETRNMGFLIPFFVLHGINVISYDQRGTGESAGNWNMSGPVQRAADVAAVFDAFSHDPMVHSKRIGVFGFSNGGWTAPIVATQRPLAFMLLKSAPGESVEQNLIYFVRQRMLLRYHDSEGQTAQALQTWRAILGALHGTTSWKYAKQMYVFASKQPWFKHSVIPSDLHLPIQGAVAAGYRRELFYDPDAALRHVRTPTLALFGARDRNVDVAHASKTLRTDFRHAGMADFTMHIFPGAGHTLEVSATGFTVDKPERLSDGYPGIMIEWLAKRGFLNDK